MFEKSYWGSIFAHGEKKTMKNEFNQINRSVSLTDEVAARIKDSILNGDYAPGDALPIEKEMVEQFGVSRVVIREALKELKSKGLIEIRRGPKGGPFVTHLDKISFGEQFTDMIRLRRLTVEQLYDARLLIEPEVIRIALKNITQEQIAELQKQVEKEKTEKDPVRRKDLFREFHRKLGEFSGNPFYALMMGSFMDFVDQFLLAINPGTFDLHDNRTHGEILKAIEARDEMKALTLLRAHLLDIRDKMLAQEQDFLSNSRRMWA
jgi:GntR family transcriptional repressor for pyruvate dehydrogenase complex